MSDPLSRVATCSVTNRPVRSISRKDWTPTSQASWTEEAASPSVVPLFEAQPLVSSKQQDFLTFANIVRRMEEGMHLTAEGFAELRRQALSMNGGGRYRRVHAL